MLTRIKSCVATRTLIKVYNVIILPYFNYCSLVWSNCDEYLLEKLQKMQTGLQGSLQTDHKKSQQKRYLGNRRVHNYLRHIVKGAISWGERGFFPTNNTANNTLFGAHMILWLLSVIQKVNISLLF